MTKGMITHAFNSAKKINMDKKVNSFINSGHFLSIPIQFQFLFFQFQFLVQFLELSQELSSIPIQFRNWPQLWRQHPYQGNPCPYQLIPRYTEGGVCICDELTAHPRVNGIFNKHNVSFIAYRGRIHVQVMVYRRLRIGRDGHFDQSGAYDIS